MIRIPATGVMLDADDLATVTMALTMAQTLAAASAGRLDGPETVERRVFGPSDTPADADRLIGLAGATLARLDAFRDRLNEVRR